MITEFYLILISTSIFSVLVFIWLIYLLNADSFLRFGLKLCRTFAGMKVRYVSRKSGKGVWCFAEKGGHRSHRHHNRHHHHHHHYKESYSVFKNSSKYPTLVFLHGFGGDKDTWPSMIRHIPSQYHCIIVDMPGHGDTTFLEDEDEPTVESYVKSLREFLEVTDLDKSKIYLIGCSFGGAVAALFAHNYPECVQNLALLCPAIKTPIMTNTCQELLSGNYNLLIPENGEQFIKMISLLCDRTQYYPKKIMQSFVNINFYPERQNLLRKILTNLVSKELENFETDFQHKISSIKTPTLIIWGKNDEMLHVSGAKYLNEKIPHSQLRILDNCNHVFQLDQPKKTTKLILEFVRNT